MTNVPSAPKSVVHARASSDEQNFWVCFVSHKQGVSHSYVWLKFLSFFLFPSLRTKNKI